jgi:hypothetical protein
MTLQRLQANQAWDKISENVLNSWVRQLELISSSVSSGDSRIAALSSSVSVINATAAFLAQVNTFTAGQIIDATGNATLTINGTLSAFLRLRDTGATDDSEIFDIQSDGGSLLLRSRNNDGSSKAVIMTLDTAGGATIGSPTGGNQGAGTLNLDNALYKDGTQVVSNRVTGWGDPFGAISRATFSTTTATTNQVAQALAALITDLKAHGLIGT